MATIDLGKIKQVFRGTYNNATAYVPDDLVVFTDTGITSTYICTTATTGNNPSSGGTAHANWAYLAKGVVDPIPSQSGNAGKFLKTNGSSLSFDQAGTIRQHKILSKITKSSTTSTTPVIIPDFSITITPTASDSIMVIEASMYLSIETHVIGTRIYNGTTQVIQPDGFTGNDDGNSSYYGSGDRMAHQTITSFETSGNTNARTYNVYWRVSSGTAWINRYRNSDSYRGLSTLRVTEVAP